MENWKDHFVEIKEKLDIKDRTYKLKTYRMCFIGSEAVSVIMKVCNLKTREEAVEIGKLFLENGLIFHVSYEHNFKDEFLFYRVTQIQKKKETKRRSTSKNGTFNGTPEEFIKLYDLRFESVFHFQEMKKEFMEFLKLESNTDPFEFLLSTESLETETTIKDLKGQVKLIKEILDTFINNKSPKELNISGSHKKFIINTIETVENNKWNFDKPPKTIFEEAVSSIRKDLFFDSWPRFKRTLKCLKIGMENVMNGLIVSSNGYFSFPYGMKDLEDPIITDKDFEFIQKISEDGPNWNMVKHVSIQKPYINAFHSNEDYFPNLGFFQEGLLGVKYEMKLSCSLNKAVNILSLQNILESDSTVIDIDIKDFQFKNDRHQLVLKQVWSFPYLDPRVYHSVFSSKYENDVFITCSKPFKTKEPWMTCYKDEIPLKRGGKLVEKNVYNVFDYYSSIIKKIDDDHCILTQIHLLALGGWGQALFKFLVKDRIPKWRDSVLEALNKYQEFNFKESDDVYLNMFAKNKK